MSPKAPKSKDLGNVKQEDLIQVGSVGAECLELKLEYDKCFAQWFPTVFLAKRNPPNMTPCARQLEAYSKCVKKAIKRLEIPVDEMACPKLLKD